MAKAKGIEANKGLDTELTRFLLMLAFDEKMNELYETDSAEFVDNWPHPLSEDVRTVLKSRNSALISKALIAQYGTVNAVATKRRRSAQKRARGKRSR